MQIFFLLIGKIVPLYGVILLGFLAGRMLNVRKESIATLLIYIISPAVVFHGAYTAEISTGNLLLPVFYFVSACLFCFIALVVGGFAWKDSTRNIFAYTAGTGNTGYFGIPVGIAVLGEQALPLIVLLSLGATLYENSLGFFVTAKGSFSAKQSLMRVVKLPTLYAFALGLLVNAVGIQLPEAYMSLAASFRGALIVLGMMLVGLGISDVRDLRFDWRFICLCFLAKFVVWPLYGVAAVVFDASVLHIFSPEAHKAILLIAIVPMAANTVALATELKVQPQKASVAVLLSTLIALVYIPIFVGLLR